ncbi:restriction endonuclease subunit S [Lactobacillus delbrueckii subsp. bulgaricus]|nr:hypothetical protein [Lactobacillus delbrueckii subsp. bulgaricus]MBT8886226.1 hypothetical protein [Lactobacillus delbrueckii subsp. bulgaricus]
MLVKLKDVAYLVNDRRERRSDDVNHFVSTENLLSDRRGVSFPASTSPKSKYVHAYTKGDILISNIRPYFKKIWKATFDGTRSADVLCFRSSAKELSQDYLYVLLESESFFNYVTKTAKGTKMPRGDKSAILEFEFNLPSLKIQKEISHQIISIEKKIRLNEQINDNLLEFLDAIFVKKFLNSYKQKDTISDFAEITRGASPRPISKYIVPTGRPWVKISDVTSLTSPFLSETKEYISEEGIQNSRTVEPGDLILSNSATPGIPIFMDLEASVHDGWLIIRNLKMISKEWLYLYFRQMRKQLVAQSNGSVFNNLKTQIVKDFPMPLITQAEVDNFQQIVAPIFGDLKVLHHENIQLKEIRDCLLSRYF